MSGVGNGCEAAPSVSGLALQSMAGELWPTPRGSKPTMSKRWLSASNSPAPAVACRKSTAGPPGPPRLKNSDPIRFAWSFAGTRATAMLIALPSGRS